MHRFIHIVFLANLLIFTGCSYLTGDDGMFRDRRGDYLEAPIEPEMRIPDNLDSYTLDQLYVIPERLFASNEDYSIAVPRPKPLDTNRPEGVVIRRYSGENWIVIAATPSQVWPRVRDFWVQAAIELEYENPVEGVMETAWMGSGGIGENRDKYRLKIEPGLHPGSSEVMVVHVSRPFNAVGMELVVWPELSDSEDKEFEILQQVSQYLADRTDIYSSSSSSLLAGNIADESKASLLDDNISNPILELRISKNRAWAQVAQALERAEIPVVDRNEDNLIVDVAFSGAVEEEDSQGFFARVFSGDDEDAVQQQFRIRMEETQTGIHVSAEELTETDTASELKTELLETILSNLG